MKKIILIIVLTVAFINGLKSMQVSYAGMISDRTQTIDEVLSE